MVEQEFDDEFSEDWEDAYPGEEKLDKTSEKSQALVERIIADGDLALRLVKQAGGIELLAENIYEGASALYFAISHPPVLFELFKTPEGRKLLTSTQWNDMTALQLALSCSDNAHIPFELAKTPEGIQLLTEVDPKTGASGLKTSILCHESFALALVKTPEGRDMLNNTKTLMGVRLIHVAADSYDSVARELAAFEMSRMVRGSQLPAPQVRKVKG